MNNLNFKFNSMVGTRDKNEGTEVKGKRVSKIHRRKKKHESCLYLKQKRKRSMNMALFEKKRKQHHVSGPANALYLYIVLDDVVGYFYSFESYILVNVIVSLDINNFYRFLLKKNHYKKLGVCKINNQILAA